MTKARIKNILDFIPLIIITIAAILLLYKTSTNQIGLQWKHIDGLILIPINYILLLWRHRLGIICLGATLLLGLFGILSYNSTITIHTLYIGPIPIFYGQPVFILWLILHFSLSGRYYIGVLTRRYWHGLLNDKEVKFD